MSWFLSCLLAVSMEQGSFFENMISHREKPCPTCSSGPEILEHETGKNLQVFMSFSAPIETWIDLSSQLEKTEGYFVVKGVPDRSFEKFAEKVLELKLAGAEAPIDIDPEAFEKYKIDAIPAFVLEDGKSWDKIEGNLRLDAALSEIAEKGEAGAKAKQILKQIREEK
jgi:conjugal transfer pilus assembly protein TrbC